MSTVRMRPIRRRQTGDELDESLPPRPRRRLLTRGTAAMTALLTCAIGFYAGVRVEKAQLPASSATTGGTGRGALAALLASRLGASNGAGTTGAGTKGGGSSGAGATGAAAAGAAGAAGAGAAGGAAGAGRLLGLGGAGGDATFGTVSTVNGRTLYVTAASGNTVKVRLTSSTKISKTRSAKRSAIRPGDTIVVQGITGSGGAVTAASVTDSGTRAGASSASSSTGSGSASSGSSAVGSLFTPGG